METTPKEGNWFFTNPMRAIYHVRRNEIPFVLNMFSHFYLVITTFWILKTLKKGLFFSFYKEQGGFQLLFWTMTAAQAELLAKILNMLLSVVAVVAFSWLAHRFRLEKLVFVFALFFIASFAALGVLLRHPGGGTAWGFYLFGDLFNTIMVATFFAALNDSVCADSARRLYGPIILGGLAGGAFGSTLAALQTDTVSLSAWMWICLFVEFVIMANAFWAGKERDRIRCDLPDAELAAASTELIPKGELLDGVKRAVSSPYVFSIVSIVGLYEIISALMDFQFSSTIEHYTDAELIPQRFGRVFAAANWVSFLVQIFLTSFVLTRFGVTFALLILPAATLAGSLGFLLYPVVLTGSLLNVFDGGFSYSINQSAKEALYVPTDHTTKYKAKAFIDMFVQRFAKVIAIFITLAITSVFTDFSAIRWISVLVLLIALIWIRRARFAGTCFHELTRRE